VKPFPSSFLWGAAVSAHAVEGGHFDSDWWRWEQRSGRIADGTTSQAGCEHRARFREDIALARKLGLNALLISLEWSRIEPSEGHFASEALTHYAAVLDAMAGEGLEPVVALYDTTVPEWFASSGGWLRPDAARLFSRYAEEAGAAFGRLSRYWVPLLTPVATVRMGYLQGLWPPGRRSLLAGWKALRHMAHGHAGACHALREHSPEAQVGASVLGELVRPADETRPWDLRVARWEQAWSIEVWPSALNSGRWPWPFGEERALADTVDFVGVSYYGSRQVRFRPGRGGCAQQVNGQGKRVPPHDYEPNAEGLAAVLHDAASFNKPLMVLGNGLATDDDRARRHYLLDHVTALQSVVNSGVEVLSYMHRSLLDGFEWDRGYRARYGLVHVSDGSMARTPNTSAYLYGDIASAGEIRKGTLARYCPDWEPPGGLELP
jgi:beta-glucosidase